MTFLLGVTLLLHFLHWTCPSSPLARFMRCLFSECILTGNTEAKKTKHSFIPLSARAGGLGIKESYSSTLWFSLDQTLCPALHLKWTPTKRKSYAWSQQMASVSSKKLSKCLKQGRDSLDTGSGKLGLSIKARDELSVSACKFRQGKHSNLYNGQQKVFLYLWLLSDCRTRQKPALTYCHQIKLLLWTCTSKHGAT